MKQEDEYIPWKSALDNLQELQDLQQVDDPSLNVFIKRILEPIYERLGDSDQLDTVKLKILICKWACFYIVGDCVERSVELFKAWMFESDPDNNNP